MGAFLLELIFNKEKSDFRVIFIRPTEPFASNIAKNIPSWVNTKISS
jgi:hypothetical protein